MKTVAEVGTPTFGFALEDPAHLVTPKEDDSLNICIGEPWYPDDKGCKTFVIPFQIHVFDARLQLSGTGGRNTKPQDCRVALAHGRPDTDRWLLADGSEVREVIEGFNETHALNPVTFAAICNLGKTTIPNVVHPIETTVGISAIRTPGTPTIVLATIEAPFKRALHWPEHWLERFT
jgi:hypothetical protein